MEKESKREGLMNGLKSRRKEEELDLSMLTFAATLMAFQMTRFLQILFSFSNNIVEIRFLIKVPAKCPRNVYANSSI